MASTKSVCDIFQTMEIADKKYLTNEGKEWLDNYKRGPKLNGHIHSTEQVDEEKKEITPPYWEFLIKSAADGLKSDLLIQILSETVCNFNDATIIVNNLYKDFHYYLETIERRAFYSNKDMCVTLTINFEDLFVLGRLIGPLLISGFLIEIECTNSSVIYFLVAIGDILCNFIPKGTKYLIRDKKVGDDIYPLKLIDGQRIEHYTPMVIFEYSDLDSVLDDLIEFSSTGDGKLYWSVTHAYIQESIFVTATEKLQQLTQQKITGIQFLRCKEQEKLREDPSSEGKNLRVFIAWDPRELDLECNLLKSVTLLPFRSIDEVTSLINSRNSACAASIWTDKLSIANRLSKLLQVGTVWINSHGLLHPAVPFESSNESRLPENGMRIVDWFKNIPCPEQDKCISLHFDKKRVESVSFLRKSIEEAVNFAEQGYETLKKMEDKEIISILENLPSDVIETLDHKKILFNISSKGNTIFQPTKNMDVLSFSEPYKTIFIALPKLYVKPEIFYKVLYCSLATKNALIICASFEDLEVLSTSIKSFTLPKGFINFLKYEQNVTSSKHFQRIGQFIWNLYKIEEIDRHGYNCNSLYSLFLRKKTVWFPVQ